MKDTLLKLLHCYGATGREDNIRSVIRAMVKPCCDEMIEDKLGNLIAVKHANGPRVMIASHMDHIGLVVSDIDENGFLRIANVGGIYASSSFNRHVVFENGVHGVLSYEEEAFDANGRSMAPLFIDIGAKTREEAAAAVSVGDVAVYAPDAFSLLGRRVSAPAMDNRVGCAVAVETLKALENCACEASFVFTVQEEVGLRGAKAAAYALEPEIGIALDVTLSGDTPKGHKVNMRMGDGVCVKILDGMSISSPKLVRRLEAIADAEGIPVQREVLADSGTDAAAMQLSRAGALVCTLSVACRYVHSACETVDVADLEAAKGLLVAFLSNPAM